MKRYLLIKNIGRLLTMTDQGKGDLGVIENAACLIKRGRIEWFGGAENIPKIEEYLYSLIDAEGGVVMPGLIDCHTHLVHGGSREMEVAERACGKSYKEIAKEGGGILSTVRATRETSFEDLCRQAAKRANEALENGITTLEVKSGYGLDIETELKILKVIYWLQTNHHMTFVSTFLGAHTVPGEYQNKRGEYVDLVADEMIPKVAGDGLAEFCDVFVERIAFNPGEARRVIEAGKKFGMSPKLHVDQMSSGGGAELAAGLGAVSADHLEYISDKGIRALAENNVTAVLIPASTFYLGEKKYAPARKLIEAGVDVALSTDYNPGSSPTLNLFLTATIATSYLKMTMEECLKGITVNAAKALGIDDGRGTIRKDGVADLLILDAPNEYYPIYRFGSSCVKCVIKNGKPLYEKK